MAYLPVMNLGTHFALSQDGNRLVLVVGSRSENGQIGAMRIYQRYDGVAASVDATIVSVNNNATLINSNSFTWSLTEGGVFPGYNSSERAGLAVSISAGGNGKIVTVNICCTEVMLMFFLSLKHTNYSFSLS